MAKIPYADEESATPEAAAILAALGSDMNIVRMLAHTGELAGQFARFGGHLLTKTSIDPCLRELAIIRVGVLCGSEYEVHQHLQIARSVGLREEAIAAIKAGSDHPEFSALEADIIRFTDDLVENHDASEETFGALQSQLDRRSLMELTLCVGFYVMVSTFLRTYRVDIEEPGTSAGPILPDD